MSSKFWTWTKGDPRAREAAEELRAGGVVSIPVEYITIRGMDQSRVARGKHRKPLPLSFGTDPTSSRTTESLMLQDAAIQSATSLMGVMNDMLRSPHLSAHLSAHHSCTASLPGYGRPRSHTAPPTPLVEAPQMELVELPGSILLDKPPNSSLNQSVAGKDLPRFESSPTHAAFGFEIERPHTSPQASTYPPVRLSGAQESSARSSTLFPPAPASPRSKCTNSCPVARPSARTEEDTLVAHENTSVPSSTQRPSLTMVQKWPTETPSVPGSTELSHSTSAQTIAHFQSPYRRRPTPEVTSRRESELPLFEQIDRMRSNQEVHLKSLKETHEKELEGLRLYVAFLEQRCTLAHGPCSGFEQILNLDTPQTMLPRGTTHSATSTATPRSFETSLETQKRTSHETYAEVETLRRKLSLCRKSQMEAGEICRERDHLRECSERSDRRIMQLKDIIQKAKDNEKALRNGTADLEARLVDSNNQRTDVLEGYHEARRQAKEFSKQATSLQQEVDDLRGRLFHTSGRHASDTALLQPAGNSRRFQVRSMSGSVSCATSDDTLLQQIESLKTTLGGKEIEIQRLQTQYADCEASLAGQIKQLDSQMARIAELEISLADQKSMVKIVQAEKAIVSADCERYNSLLHAELRRRSRCAVSRKSPLPRTPDVEAEASAVVAEKLQSTKSNWLLGSAKLEDTNAALEKELVHCTQDIILYKLEIQGYKKNLQAAHAQLESMSAIAKRPPTPDRESGSSGQGRISEEVRRAAVDASTAGLGIAFAQPPPHTPTRTAVSGMSAGLLAAVLPAPSVSLSPRTNKKLPKPPTSRSASPMPASLPQISALHRGETMRSLSDSIISSYAKRSPTPQETDSSPSPFTTPGPLPTSKSTTHLMDRVQVVVGT